MRYAVNQGDIHNHELEFWAKFVSKLSPARKQELIDTPTRSHPFEVSNFLTRFDWSTEARATCGRKVLKDENGPVLHADGTKQVVNPDLFEQYTNPDQEQIIESRFKIGGLEGYNSDGPAEKFSHDINYRPIGTIEIEGKYYPMYAVRTVRTSLADPSDQTLLQGIALMTGDKRMVEIVFKNNGQASDLSENFIDIRIKTEAGAALRTVNAGIDHALTNPDIQPGRSEQLGTIKARNAEILAKLAA